MRIGIYGGSFNPIHYGHIAIGRWMLEHKSLDEVWYMVSPQNPLKGAQMLLTEEERLKLVTAALADQPGLEAKDYEFHMPRPSYTWATLQQLRKDFPQHDFILIIGGDNWDCFHLWRNWKDILWQYEVAVFPRNGELPVSSTMVRNNLSQGKSITNLVPQCVAEFFS